ncbi:MAG TPA: amino acid ABC transporter permease [Anaerolineales bacterium]|nr:amino acid ABC transporter permease [Anaerolineales bacterium]
MNNESTNPQSKINWQMFYLDNLNPWYTSGLWVAVLAVACILLVVSQMASQPLLTMAVIVVWAVLVAGSIMAVLNNKHSGFWVWLQKNLFSSLSNVLLTLLVGLVVVSSIWQVFNWGVLTASFDPERTAVEYRTPETGAVWGVIWGARKLLATGSLGPEYNGRVILSAVLIAILGIASLVVYNERNKNATSKGIVTVLWLIAPLALFIFLVGLPTNTYVYPQTLLLGTVVVMAVYGFLRLTSAVSANWVTIIIWLAVWPVFYICISVIGLSGIFPPINTNNWGGFLLTIILSIFTIVCSFPIGLLLALGRRADFQGIPWWIVYPLAGVLTVWLLFTFTPSYLKGARNFLEQLIAFSPLLILVAAYFFIKVFKGNVVAAFCTLFIELVRGVPLVTVMFMATRTVPFVFPPELFTDLPKVLLIMVGMTLFSAAYLAENVRGGLQAIPKGQYEASDAIALNGVQKMRFIILPQALRLVIPAMLGLFIGIFKDTSLVYIVGMFDFLFITRNITANPQWLGLRFELYTFIAVVYFIVSWFMSRYSSNLETRLGVGQR